MKKLKTITILFIMIIGLFSCENNFEVETSAETSPELVPTEIAWAKEWIEMQDLSDLYLKSGDKVKKKVTPAWGKGKKYTNNKVDVYEIPLNSSEILGYATEDILDVANSTGNNKYLLSETRLLIQRFKKSDVVTAHFMIIIGSPDYMETTDFNLKPNTYLKKDKDFSGYVVFYELDGRLNTGYKYTNGKVTHRITEHGESGIDIELKNAVPSCTKINVYQDVIGYHYEFGIEVIDYEYTKYLGYFVLCGGSGGGTTDGGTTLPPSDTPCLCDPCPVCGGCLGDPWQLKSLPLPGEDGETENTYHCPSCSCPEIDWDDITNNDKAFCVLQKLIKTGTNEYNSLVLSFIAAFSGNEPYRDIVFEIGSLSGYGAFDPTVYPPVITLGAENISNRAPIEIAKTLMHEMFHAFIFQDGMLTPSPFVDNFADYIETKNGITYSNHHELMHAHYITPMINFLKDFDSLSGHLESDEYYKGLALSGLQEDVSLTQTELNSITLAEDFFRNRGINCE